MADVILARRPPDVKKFHYFFIVGKPISEINNFQCIIYQKLESK